MPDRRAGVARPRAAAVLAVAATLAATRCAGPSPPTTSSAPAPHHTPSTASSVPPPRGAAADVRVTTCRQDPTDDTEVVASGTIVDPLDLPADYTFTIQWYRGSMRVTQTSESLTGAIPHAPLPWTTQADLALAAGGGYSCRIVRVIRSAEHPQP